MSPAMAGMRNVVGNVAGKVGNGAGNGAHGIAHVGAGLSYFRNHISNKNSTCTPHARISTISSCC